VHAFREAIEARDLAAVPPLLAEDVVMNSPIAHRPYTGRAITAAVVRGAARVFEDFRYVGELADGRDHALVFRATVRGREIHGCDFLHTNEDGLIDELTVMVRPLSAANALAEAMGAEFDRISAEAMSA
jgi:hypothetical protein